MNIIFYIVNRRVIPPAMFFAGNFYKFKGEEIKFRGLWISIRLLFLTAIVTSLQFIFPEIIIALDRNRQALLSGEVWRLITPLFIQPMGIWQCVFNGVFFISFVPIAERLYGRGVLLIYFATGIVGQIVNLLGDNSRGATSWQRRLIHGLVWRCRFIVDVYTLQSKDLPKGIYINTYSWPIGASVLIFYEDGHAPALLFGAMLGLLLHRNTRQITPYPHVKH